jgi:hypothetical protein
VHTAFAEEVNALGRSDLRTEVAYRAGQWLEKVPPGTRGFSRVDVVLGDVNRPLAVFDLKTGGARMSKEQLDALARNLPEFVDDITAIFEIFPP